MIDIVGMGEIFSQTELHYDLDWLVQYQAIIAEEKKYKDDLFEDSNILIDLFCLQEIKEVAFAVSRYDEHNIEESIADYLRILDDLEIDFNLFILLAGEDFYSSDFYQDYEESSPHYILLYLIDQNYYRVSTILVRHYADNQKLLESIIEPFPIYAEYQKALTDIETLEDYFDYPEVVKLYEWAVSGFDISGEA